MTKLAKYIEKQLNELKNTPKEALKSKKEAIIISYKQAGIMTQDGVIKKEFR